MKKLALLLGALSLVSSVAYAKEVVPAVEEVVVVEEAAPVAAAPALRVTSFGQSIEIDNYSRHDNRGYKLDADTNDIGNVMLGTSVGLAYGDDWTFNFFARKGWDTDTDKGTHSNGHRIDMDVWRSFDNFSVGARWRQEANKDRYLLRGKYSYGMFSGWVDAGYESQNVGGGSSDNWYSEGMPVAVTVGPLTVGYYYEWDDVIDYHGADEYEGSLKHQIRLMAPLYTGEKLSVGAEYRYQFAHDMDYAKEHKWAENNRHIAIVNAAYAVTERLTVSGYYEYDFNDYDLHDAPKGDKLSDDYYGEFGLGWTYSF